MPALRFPFDGGHGGNLRKEALPIRETQNSKKIRQLAKKLLKKVAISIEQLDAVVVTYKEKSKDAATGADIQKERTEILKDEKGPIDRGALKQLTGILKDLQDILGADEEASALEVILEELADEYAQ